MGSSFKFGAVPVVVAEILYLYFSAPKNGVF